MTTWISTAYQAGPWQPPKNQIRTGLLSRVPYDAPDAAHVQARNMGGDGVEVGFIFLRSNNRIYAYDPLDTTTAHNGTTVLVDANVPGRRYKHIGSIDPLIHTHGPADLTTGGFSWSAGNLELTLDGNWNIPHTPGVARAYEIGGTRFAHRYQATGTNGQNTFVGRNAGNASMAGSGGQASANTGIGDSALAALTIGESNVAVGRQAGASLTSGSRNVFVGDGAGQSASTASDNFCLGLWAGINLTTGQYNFLAGTFAAIALTTGSFNTVINSLVSNMTGGNNTVMAINAGANLTTGEWNTLIGRAAGMGITTGSFNTIIGAQVTGLAATLSNNVIIADGAGNIRVQVDSAGVIDCRGPVRHRSYTVATVPSASASGAGAQIYVSNEAGGAVVAFSDGTNWRRVTDRAIIS